MNSDDKPDVNYRWQCRRGMLELDLLLNNFVDKKVDGLTPQQKQTFELLLSYPDQTLLELLLGRMAPADREVARIVQEIRNATAP